MNKLLEFLFQKKMFLTVLVTYILSRFILKQNTIGIAKTVGWDLDLSSIISPINSLFLLLLFTIIYLIIALLRWKTNKTISIIHFGVIVISIVLFEIHNLKIIQICNFISILLVVINTFWSFNNRKAKEVKTSV